MLASALPLAACSKDTPTSPTQPGPPVSETPAPAPPQAPEPTPPEPTPPVDNRPIVTVTGPVLNLDRSGQGGLTISFRIDDSTIVRAAGDTPVINGSATVRTDYVVSGQTVSVEGRRSGAFLDATKITITAQAP
jgi:hypothetical protein